MQLDLETLKPTLIGVNMLDRQSWMHLRYLLEYLEYCWIRQKCLQYLLLEVFAIFIQDVG